ncbi:phosphotransferase family protein [Mangrovihabitans endophyticus]|uniref:Aminoglycoside phosphotransferase domain-containing protein n=1 Tax=Mangrovihabitans endophyticus TaxID=1751298 RepID=A0A8J3FSM2_9ACTN|nr:phosphotransferase [Mangrovihabitans endophyticus]GGL15389.1 hypothetical protein GCM10012284_57550 [Mangrovihabitans endophyticus]
MHTTTARDIAAELGADLTSVTTLAGGFSHETSLLTTSAGTVVARVGGAGTGVEAAVMAAAARHVPVPGVLLARPWLMVIEHVKGTLLEHALATMTHDPPSARALGAEVGRVAAAVSAVRFARPGFFTGADLAVGPQPPWSQQLAPFADGCMATVPEERLDAATRRAWAALCARRAPDLREIDEHARLVHADLNPKNILVSGTGPAWRVEALLDWEFSIAGCAYGDAANMARFGADYPDGFLAGFTAAFAAHQPDELPPPAHWQRLGEVMDMFALSDLVTRPAGHLVADRAAGVIRRMIRAG